MVVGREFSSGTIYKPKSRFQSIAYPFLSEVKIKQKQQQTHTNKTKHNNTHQKGTETLPVSRTEVQGKGHD
jgi:hypothetical protein